MSMNPWKYSAGRNKNKKSIQARSVMAWCLVVPLWDVTSRQWNMEIGMEQTQEGEISSCEYAAGFIPRLK